MQFLKIVRSIKAIGAALALVLVSTFCVPVFADLTAQCVQDLCGNVSSKTKIRQSAAQSARIDEDFDQQVRPLLNQFVEKALDRSKKYNSQRNLLLDKISKAQEIKMSDDLVALANQSYIADLMGNNEVFEAIGNQKKLEQVLKKKGVLDTKYAAQTLAELKKSPGLTYLSLPIHVKFSDLSKKNSEETFSSALANSMTAISLSMFRLGLVSEFLYTSLPWIVHLYNSAPDAITDDDSEELFKAIGRALLIFGALDDRESNTYKKNLLNIKRDFRKEALANLQNDKFWRGRDTDYQPFIESTMQLCEKKIKNRLHSAPARASIETFKNQVLPKAMASLRNVTIKLGIAESLENVHWKLPMPYEKELEQLKGKIKWNIENLEEKQKTLAKFEEALIENNEEALSIAVFSLVVLSEEDENPLVSVFDACQRIETRVSFDHFKPEKGTVHLGWQTIVGIDSSFTLGHEAGHYLFRKHEKHFSTSKQCLVQRHSGIQGGKSFLEEDFADLVGVELEKEMNGFRDGRLFCLDRDHELAAHQFSSVAQKNKKDTHSSHLFRLITLANARNALPQSCRKLVEASKASSMLKRCELKP